MESKEKILLAFLGQVFTHLDRCKNIYDRYMQDGKKYLYAKVLRDANGKIKDLILSQAYLLSKKEYSEILELLEHIDIWIVLWDDLAGSKEFDLNESFVFENTCNFPRAAAASLEVFLEKLKNCS